MQCILEKIILGTRTVRGNANDWHHVGVVMVVGNTVGAVAVPTSLLMCCCLQLTEVVDTRVDDDITQFVLVAPFPYGGGAVTVAVAIIVVNVVATTVAVVVVVVADYGSG